MSRGAFVTFIDADDRWEPDLLKRAIACLDHHPECGAFTASYYLQPSGQERYAPLRRYGFDEGPWSLATASRRELGHCTDAFHMTAVYRREVAVEAGGYYTEHRCTLGEDIYFWIKVLLRHPIYRCMQPLGHYHMEESQLGIGTRGRNLPLEPMLTDPDPIRDYCPPPLQRTFELWLAWQAIRAAFMQIARDRSDIAAQLVRDFPMMRAWTIDYARLSARLRLPGLWSLAQGVKRARL